MDYLFKLRPNNFLHKKNFFIIVVLNLSFKIFFKIFNLIGLPRKRKSNPQTVLFIEPAHLGDALLTTPAIRFLKENRKNLKIHCLVSTEGGISFENNNYITEIHTINLPWFKDKGSIFQQIIYFIKLIKLLKKINSNVAINVRSTSYHREHLAMWMAGIPERIGYSHKGFGFLLTHEVQYIVVKQSAKLKLDVVSSWLKINDDKYSLKPDFFIPADAENNANHLLKSIRESPNEILVAISPGAQHNFLWGIEYYVKLCRLIDQNSKAKIIFIGTNNFETYVQKIQNQLNFKTYSLIGQTTLNELAAILEDIDLLITVDTGVRYIASAIGLKTIVLIHGASSLIEFGKHVETEFIIRNEVPCSPCGKNICPLDTVECMVGINPDEVFEIVCNIITI